jgi:hypothetical protein
MTARSTYQRLLGVIAESSLVVILILGFLVLAGRGRDDRGV